MFVLEVKKTEDDKSGYKYLTAWLETIAEGLGTEVIVSGVISWRWKETQRDIFILLPAHHHVMK